MLRPGCCAALPITAEGGEDTLVLMSEIRPETPTDGAELDEALRGVIRAVSESEGVRPSAIVLLKARSILKTTSGKLRRREMRQAYAQLVLGGRPAERGPWLIPESAVVHVWRDSAKAAPARQDYAAPAPARQAPDEAVPLSNPHHEGVPLSISPQTLTATVEENARRFRGRRLYSWLRGDCSEEATLSFQELREQTCSLCVALRRKWGVDTGDRVMLVYPPGLDFLVAFFAAQYAAAIAVPYYPPIMPASPMPSAGAKKLLADGLQKLARIAQSCQPVLFLSTKMYLRAQWLCSMAVRDAECRWPADWKWQATDGAAATPVTARDEPWLREWLAGRCEPAEPGEVAFLQYTSGSTGHPKGVMVGTRNLLANIDAIAQTRLCHATMGSVGVERVGVCSWLPQYHDMGLIGGCLAAAVRGWRADLTSPFIFLQRPVVWLQMVTRLRETHLVMQPAPNFGYALCVRRIKDDALPTLSLSHWHIAMNGAEPIRAQTVQDFATRFAACGFDPCAWAPVFGLAENCLYCCGRAEETVILRVDRARLGVGDRPMPQSGPVETSVLGACGHFILPESVTKQAVRIVHSETCEEQPDGTVGEIWVCGPSVAGGYWGLEDLSRDTFRARVKSTTSPTDAPHLRSGDLGFIWERRLYIVGRIKDVLTIKGRTLHAHDIEVCAERGSHMLRPGCCAALPITAEGGEDTLVLMSEIRPETPTDGAELDEALRGVIRAVSESEGVRPSAIVLLKARSILKTTSGKLRRREMRQAYAQLVLGGRPAERGPWLIPESAVVHVWRDSASAEVPSPVHTAPAPTRAVADAPCYRSIKLSESGTDLNILNVDPTPPTQLVVTPVPSPKKMALTLGEAQGIVVDVFGMVVSADAPLMEAGLDSAAAVEFGALLSERVGVLEMPETLIFDYPTLRGVVGYLNNDTLTALPLPPPVSVSPISIEEAQAIVAEVVGFCVSADAPLMDAGLDSAAAVEFGALLSERIGVPELPETLIFDYPTLRGIVGSFSQQREMGSGVSAPPDELNRRDVAIAGLAARLPHGHASREQVQRMSASGADATSEVPHGRWSLPPSSSGDSEVARRIRHGAFVTDADLFDNKCFSISPAESAAMDPQQRMLLEAGYEALHASSLGKVELMGSLTGVFVGIAAMDFGEMIKSTPYANSVYSATGSTLSVASGRISYALGLMGPCVSYDTACSAALAACHASLRAMPNDECADGLVAGASVMLLPGTAFAFATAGMTSARGRCHTFDSRADGYCRGEAICGMALRARTATTHYQLPRSLATIVLAASEPHAPLALGSVKANSGHAEPAAGAAGLFRLAMGLSFDAAPPNAQLRSINPHVGSALSRVACALPTQAGRLPRSPYAGPPIGGVSSFGYSGTIVHTVVEMAQFALPFELDPLEALRYNRRSYTWRKTPHPLVNGHKNYGREGNGMEADVFCTPSMGPLLQIVADHVVQGRVVFPGAGCMEMARAAAVALSSGAMSATLSRVFFLQPLVLEGDLSTLAVRIEISAAEERFDVTTEDLEAGTKTSHCAGGATALSEAMPCFSHAALRAWCTQPVDTAVLYAGFRSVGLEYGPLYRTLTSARVSRGAGIAVGQLRRRSRKEGTSVHPADLDDSLHLTALLAEVAAAGEIRLPFSVGEAALADVSGSPWPVAERQGAGKAGVWIGAKDAKAARDSPGARHTNFETRALKAAMRAAPVRRLTHLYVTSWQAATVPPAESARAALVMCASAPAVPASCSGVAQAAAPSASIGSIVYAVGLGTGAKASDSLAGLAAAVDVVRMQVIARSLCPVWMVSAGALAARSAGTGASSQAGLMGLTRQARSEAPQSCLPLLDMDVLRPGVTELAAGSNLAGKLGLGFSGASEPEVAFDDMIQRVPRLAEAAGSLGGPIKLYFDARGAVSNLRVVPQAVNDSKPVPGEVKLHVGAVGLNFRDVLNVLGVYPGDPGPPGGDCAAHIAAKGPGSSHIKVGDAVLGHGLAALASVSRSDARLVASITESLSFEQACTLPTTWMTVHLSLLAARPAAGHGALLHAGAGGVGLTAQEYCHLIRSSPSASVGRPYKHFYLARMGLAGRTVSSRESGAFAVGASRLLSSCRLRFSLNSLSADFIACTVALLRQDGWLCEIGKRAVWSCERLESASLSRYVAIALDSTIEQMPVWVRDTLQLLSRRADGIVLHGLPLQTFELERSVLAAFRTLQGGTNTGKVVVRIPRTAPTPPRGAHLLSGGTGSLGLVTGRWLGEAGAATVVLAARGGKVAAADGEKLKKVARCSFRVVRCDAAELTDTARIAGAILAMRTPLAGVWHAAGVLSDGLLRAQTAATVRRVFVPKVAGAWALQQAAASSPLDACVLFSSIAALIGGGGQSNYAAANSMLDALGACRRTRAVKATSVQWGPWAAVGMAADASVNARIQASGVGLISLEQGTLALQATLQPSVPGVMSLAVLTWSKFLSLLPEVPPLMVNYASRRGKAVTGGTRGEVKEVTLEAIRETLKSTTGAEVDPDAPLMESGLDSLGAVELGNQLQAQSGLVLPSTLVFDYPTARQLAGYFKDQVSPAEESEDGEGTNVAEVDYNIDFDTAVDDRAKLDDALRADLARSLGVDPSKIKIKSVSSQRVKQLDPLVQEHQVLYAEQPQRCRAGCGNLCYSFCPGCAQDEGGGPAAGFYCCGKERNCLAKQHCKRCCVRPSINRSCTY